MIEKSCREVNKTIWVSVCTHIYLKVDHSQGGMKCRHCHEVVTFPKCPFFCNCLYPSAADLEFLPSKLQWILCHPAMSPCYLSFSWMNSQVEEWFADLGKINQSIWPLHSPTYCYDLVYHSTFFKITKVSFSCSSPSLPTLGCTGLSLSLTHCRKIALSVQKIVLPKKWTRSIPKRTLCCMYLGLHLVSTHLMQKTVINETPSSKVLIIQPAREARGPEGPARWER